MSEGLWGGIIGALLAGSFLIGAQLLASRAQSAVSREASSAQAEMAREAARAQADLAREAWDRSQRAQAHAQLENTCLEVIRYIQQIQHAVSNWEAGSMQATQAHASINAGAAAVMESGYGIILRKGPDDPTAHLIGLVIEGARTFSGLFLVDRQPLATVAQKQAQRAVVEAAAAAVLSRIHELLKADAGPET
jgi:hypothetical protein